MSQFTADVRPETPDVQEILGGTCPIHPIQCCIVWSARQEKIISPLAFRVYFAAHEVKYWRSKTKPGETYQYESYGFQLYDISRLLPGVPDAKIAKAFGELKALNILKMDNTGICFAENIDDVNINERVKHRILSMFNQFHQDTRDKIIKIPRRLLKLIVQCGKRIVRAATLIGMLLTTMLTKRTENYGGYKGCCKAEFIGKLFGVNTKRVNHERAKLINEGWFTREPTTPRIGKKFGQWVRLNLTPAQPTSDSEPTTSEPISEAIAIEESDPEESAIEELVSEKTASSVVIEVQPQNDPNELKVQPLLNLPLSSSEESLNNQELSSEEQKTGAYQPKTPGEATWINIQPSDLKNDANSEKLWAEAIKLGHLKNTHPDRINFYAAIAHALRVAKNNVCGLLRTIVEKSLWHVISQVDEYNAIQRLRSATKTQETKKAQRMPANPFLTMNADRVGQFNEQPIELSEDALIVQTLTVDLKRAGVKGDVFRIVQRNGYLRDWDKERWLRAEQELAQAQLLRARQWYQTTGMTSC